MRPPIFEVVQGDVREVLRTFPDESVHCAVTSPPYHLLRSYEDHPGQIGLEPTFDDWVREMVLVFREVRRVLRRDGTLWLNVGRSYAGKRSFQGKADGTDGVFARRAARLGALSEGSANGNGGRVEGDDAFARRDVAQGGLGHGRDPAFKDQDLVMQGHLLAEALRRDGWWLRSDCAWWKNALPESVTSRPATTHENVFMLTKGRDAYFDMEAVRTILKPKTLTHRGGGRNGNVSDARRDDGRDLRPRQAGGKVREVNSSGANLRDVWADVSDDAAAEFLQDLWLEFVDFAAERLSLGGDVWKVSNEPFPGRHFATFPTALVSRCVKASTSERGCCPRCGAPWERTVTKGEPDAAHRAACGADANGEYLGQSTKGHGAAGVQDASAVKARILAGMRERISTWAPGCACVGPDGAPLEAVPSLVMDPFAGTGRAGRASVALGRDFVGVELVQVYAEMARQNIADPGWERRERARIRAEKAEAFRAAAGVAKSQPASVNGNGG